MSARFELIQAEILHLTKEEQLELLTWMAKRGMNKAWPRGTWLQKRRASVCSDCGQEGEIRGHMTCPYPSSTSDDGD